MIPKKLMSRLKLYLILGLCIAMTNAQALTLDETDELRAVLKDNINHANIGAGYAHMLNFFIQPDISSSHFDVDDGSGSEFDLHKFPFQKSFAINDQGWDAIVRGTLSYGAAKNKAMVFNDEVINAKWRAYSGNIGAGLIIPVYEKLSFIGAADFGLSRIESDAKYKGDFLENTLAPIIDGILYNWETNAWIGSLVLGLDYLKPFEGRYDLDVKGRYTYSYVSSFSEPKDLPAFSDSINTLSLKADFTHPIGISVADYPLYGVAHVGNTTFVGQNRDVLGFNYFFEFGYSLKIDISRNELPVESLSLGCQRNKGDNVEGYTVLFGWKLATF